MSKGLQSFCYSILWQIMIYIKLVYTCIDSFQVWYMKTAHIGQWLLQMRATISSEQQKEVNVKFVWSSLAANTASNDTWGYTLGRNLSNVMCAAWRLTQVAVWSDIKRNYMSRNDCSEVWILCRSWFRTMYKSVKDRLANGQYIRIRHKCEKLDTGYNNTYYC